MLKSGNYLNMISTGWKKSLIEQVIVVVKMHKEFVEVWNSLLKTFFHPLRFVFLITRNASDVTE